KHRRRRRNPQKTAPKSPLALFFPSWFVQIPKPIRRIRGARVLFLLSNIRHDSIAAEGGFTPLEPISHFFYSHRLKLQFWDWGTEGKPTMILVHGGMEHARNRGLVAREIGAAIHHTADDLPGGG